MEPNAVSDVSVSRQRGKRRGMTDEQYLEQAECCRKAANFARDEREKAAWLTLAAQWLGLMRHRLNPVPDEAKTA
jgi:hypothetical protein